MADFSDPDFETGWTVYGPTTKETTMTTQDDLERMLAGGAKSYFNRDSRIGDSVTGVITQIDVRQATEYGTNAPLIFPDGAPKEQIVVTIKADVQPDSEDDDMHRAIYIKGWGNQRRAFIDAVRKANIKKPEAGDRFTATFTAETPSKQGGNPAKVYEYRIVPGTLDHGASVPTQEIDEARAQAQKLWGMGSFTAKQIAAATALPLDEVQALNAGVDERRKQETFSNRDGIDYSDNTPF